MNAERRKELTKAAKLIEDAKAIVEQCAADERDYYDNMPENMQSSDKGEKASSDADALEEADGPLQEVLDAIENAITA